MNCDLLAFYDPAHSLKTGGIVPSFLEDDAWYLV
jgi:hypothetical protein